MKSVSIAGWVKPLALGGVSLLFLVLLNTSLGRVPAIGRFFNPFSGFWRNAESGHSRDGMLSAPGLHETVTVTFDKRQVPHIFAQNDHDLYFAQGYVTARDRLWQMEIQAMSAAGRLSEILGPSRLDHDRFQRRLGMVEGAERSLELLKKNRDGWIAAQAYADGVNAWIQRLDPADFPVEYKLLGYAPGHWTPLNTLLLIKHMQWSLSGSSRDLPMSNTLAKFGADFVARFFPLRAADVPPVIPSGSAWSFPGSSDSSTAPASADSGKPSLFPALPVPVPVPVPVPEIRPDPGNGSNNFVIAGSRTRSGHPLLANDPHLDLGLPSIWYEVQLSAPGVSAYGVSLPGSPSVLIGFNRKIAWGLTNGQDDVFDWYRIAFKDSGMSEYMHGNQWKPTRKVVEAMRVRGKITVLDTVVHTHHGPVALRSREQPWNRNTPAGHALRWLALDPSDELGAFLAVMRAGNYEQFAAALESFHCPSQNFAFASVSGDIAMFHHGLFPRKWRGQGRFILDGSEPGNDWSGWLRKDEVPASRNPAQGWLFSANQSPMDSAYPNFLGGEFMNGRRPKRLADLLEAADSASVESAFGILVDGYNQHAAEILPVMLDRISRAVLSSRDSAARHDLAEWDYRHQPRATAPALFDAWWRILYRSVWADEFGGDSIRYQWPDKDRTRRLITEEPAADWFDDISTPSRETLAFLTLRSFQDACASLRRTGPGATADSAGSLDWAAYRPVNIRHLARIDAFSRLKVAAGGCSDCVNALKTAHGPSWRMVVSLDGKPQGVGIYPGGQSGNPGSPHYDEFVGDWAAGRHYDLAFLSGPGDGGEGTSYRLQLRGN